MFHSFHLPRVCRWFAAATLTVATSSLLIAQAASGKPNPGKVTERAQTSFAQLPLSFEPNLGQTDSSVQFLAHSPAANIYLTGSDAVIARVPMKAEEHKRVTVQGQSPVRMHLLGAAERPVETPESALPGKINYLTGNDRSQWHTGVPTYSGVRLASVYPGVDLRYYGHGGALEYDFIVAPQHSADAIRFTFSDGNARVESSGDLMVTTQDNDPLRFEKPVAYQVVDGKRLEVAAQFQLAKNGEVSFELGSYDHSRELVIDPTLVYLGTLGTGIQQVYLSQMTVDSAGALYMIGTTNDSTFPVTSGAYQKVCGPTKGNSGQLTYAGGYCPSGGGGEQAAFISKLSADGTQLVYSTYLSGQSGTEQGASIAVDASGVAYLLGTTGSNDFPITSDAFQKQCYAYYNVFGGPNIVNCDGYYNGGGTEYTIGNQDAFFAKLSADGSSLLYSSFLGGTQQVYPNTIALDSTGNIYLSGQVGIFDTSDLTPCQSCGPNSQGQLQFTGITPTGYLTGSAAVDQAGNNQRINAAAFVSKFSNDGHTLLYGTFLADNTAGVDVVPTTAAVGANGIIFVGGYTLATNFPVTAGALKAACVQPNQGSGGVSCNTYDGFVTAIDTTKSGSASLAYSTRLGGAATIQGSNTPDQEVLGLLADSSNDVFATGYTLESTFNVGTTGYQTACPNNTGNSAPTAAGYVDQCNSAFLLKIDPTGTKLQGGTFFAAPSLGSPQSIGETIRVDSRGNVLLYGKGSNYGDGFPVLNPLQAENQPPNVLFVAAFTPDLSNLLFSTLFGNPSHLDHGENTVGVGMALDANDNIYIAGDTVDTDFGTTAGTYITAQTTGQGHHPFFAKITKVLQPTKTILTAPATALTGQNITLKAVVAGIYQTTPAPTGTVTFTATSTTTSTATTLGTASLDATGTATATLAAPAADSYTVTATYGSDGVYDYSTSSSATLATMNPIQANVTLASSAASISSGSAVTFTATVGASGTALSPTGTVTFLDGTTTLGMGSLANGTAAYSTSSLSVGAHSVTAQYSGDGNFAPATSAPVTETVSAATISLTASPTTLTITHGQSGTVTITGTPMGAYSGTVSFSCGNAIPHISCAFAPATLTFNNATAAQSTTLTINTDTNTAAMTMPRFPGQNRGPGEPVEAGLLATFGLLAVVGRRSTRRKLRGTLLLMTLSAALLTMGAIGCGGGGSSANSTPATNATPSGAYTLPITASVSGSNVTLNLKVVVQ